MFDITVRDDVFPLDLATELMNKWRNSEFKFYWRSHTGKDFFHWHKDIVSGKLGTTEDHVSELIPDSLEAKAWNVLQDKLIGPAKLLRYYVNGYTFGTEGHPHTDSNEQNQRTAILYLNDNWRLEFGGETVIFNHQQDDIDCACLPKLGRVLYFPSYRYHAGRSVSRTFPGMRLILVCKVMPL